MEPTTTPLPLLDTTADGGCGCGCGTAATPTTSEKITITKGTDMTTQTYSVTGMTCGHCEHAVSSELKTLNGVTDVSVDLVAGGTSSVTVTSTQPLDEAQVAAALDEAGDYQLA
jgi:copper chaperone CopZ